MSWEQLPERLMETRTDSLDFLGVGEINLFHLLPSIDPIPGFIGFPVWGHGGGPMHQICNEL